MFSIDLLMAEDGGVEPHPISENLVFKASRRTIPAALPSLFGIPGGTRTPTNGFGDRHAAITPPRYCLVQPTRIELVSMVPQTAAMTTSARVAWCLVTGSNCRPSPCKGATHTAELTRPTKKWI